MGNIHTRTIRGHDPLLLVPPRLPRVIYTQENRETWSTLIRRFWAMIPNYMCQEYLDAFDRMEFPIDHVPYLGDVENRLRQYSDWHIEAVDGLTPSDEFFGLLAQKKFPSNTFIRGAHEIDYTPSPDIFHEVVGHVPMLTNPFVAEFTHQIGQIATRVLQEHGPDKLTPITRIYWFTLEFGLIDTPDGVRIFGAGFGPGEMQQALTASVEKKPFIVEDVARTPYNYWEMQKKLFVISSFQDMAAQFHEWADRFDPSVDYGRSPHENV